MPAGVICEIQNPDGSRPLGTGEILLTDRAIDVKKVTHNLEFYDGSARIKSGNFALTDAEGTLREFELEDMGWVYCQGGGYFGGFNDRLGQGAYRGDFHEEGEVWDCSHPYKIIDPEGEEIDFGSVLAESFVRLKSGNQVGTAHFECAAFGPYPRYGLTGIGGT